MTQFDLSPLYRTLVGFDRLAGMIDQAQRLDGAGGYPPYNIEKIGEDTFRIEIAVAGFAEDDLTVELRDGALVIAGKRNESKEQRQFLHRGIAERAFERRFQLADHVRVNGAALAHGLLVVELVREVPEALKSRRIDIQSGAAAPKSPAKVIDGKASPKAKAVIETA